MIKQLSWGLPVLAGLMTVVAGGVAAQTTNCTTVLTPGSSTSVNVPAGATCTVSGPGTVDVAGNVSVGTNGSLAFTSNANFVVNGSLIGTNAFTIDISPASGGAASILGSVSLTGIAGFVGIDNSFIGGTLSVSGSNPVDIFVVSNTVSGNVLIRNNTTRGGANSDVIQGNTIGSSLVCSGNVPAPVDLGTANTVGGNKVGQCSGL